MLDNKGKLQIGGKDAAWEGLSGILEGGKEAVFSDTFLLCFK